MDPVRKMSTPSKRMDVFFFALMWTFAFHSLTWAPTDRQMEKVMQKSCGAKNVLFFTFIGNLVYMKKSWFFAISKIGFSAHDRGIHWVHLPAHDPLMTRPDEKTHTKTRRAAPLFFSAHFFTKEFIGFCSGKLLYGNVARRHVRLTKSIWITVVLRFGSTVSN